MSALVLVIWFYSLLENILLQNRIAGNAILSAPHGKSPFELSRDEQIPSVFHSPDLAGDHFPSLFSLCMQCYACLSFDSLLMCSSTCACACGFNRGAIFSCRWCYAYRCSQLSWAELWIHGRFLWPPRFLRTDGNVCMQAFPWQKFCLVENVLIPEGGSRSYPLLSI